MGIIEALSRAAGEDPGRLEAVRRLQEVARNGCPTGEFVGVIIPVAPLLRGQEIEFGSCFGNYAGLGGEPSKIVVMLDVNGIRRGFDVTEALRDAWI
jgi:hypothetical protein